MDDNLAESHNASIVLVLYDLDYVGAERQYRRMIELNPNYALAIRPRRSPIGSRMKRHGEIRRRIGD